MSKMTGPCFELKLEKNGADIRFIFLPGNLSRQVYENTRDALYSAFQSRYTINADNYARKIITEDGMQILSIEHKKAISATKIILDSHIYRGFKFKVTGLDREGNEKTIFINTPIECENMREVDPYYNKNNNDLTTRRRK